MSPPDSLNVSVLTLKENIGLLKFFVHSNNNNVFIGTQSRGGIHQTWYRAYVLFRQAWSPGWKATITGGIYPKGIRSHLVDWYLNNFQENSTSKWLEGFFFWINAASSNFKVTSAAIGGSSLEFIETSWAVWANSQEKAHDRIFCINFFRTFVLRGTVNGGWSIPVPYDIWKLCSKIAVSKIRNGKVFLLNCAGTARKDQQRREANEKRQKQFAKLCQDDAGDQYKFQPNIFFSCRWRRKSRESAPHSLQFLWGLKILFVLIHIFLENCRRTGHRRIGLAWQDNQASKWKHKFQVHTLYAHGVVGRPAGPVVDNTALSRKVLNDAASHFPCMRWAVGEIICSIS